LLIIMFAKHFIATSCIIEITH